MTHFNEVTAQPSQSGTIPLITQPKGDHARLPDWINANKALLDRQLTEHGAVLFRDFHFDGEEEFQSIVTQLCDHTLSYVYRSTPRTQVGANVYTATEYPAHMSIPFHNETAYARDWPTRLIFYCVLPAEEGGETPIADTVKVTMRIPAEILDKFAKKRVMYVRNYGTGVDLDWPTVFQTSDKAEVEHYCTDHGIEFEWWGNGCLRTRQVCQAVASHPYTGKLIWFNQAHLFHVSSLDEKTRKSMLKIYKESELPRNTYYGDGSPIEDTVLDQIRASYEAERVVFPWKANDVLVVDNMLVSHARNPFKGKRRVLVGMGDAYSAVVQKQLTASA
jgi:alpha-ketoglutarate-dependent taurine dioxygenase